MSSSKILSWAEATKVKPIDSHTYEVNLDTNWCIGSVPNGGYVTSVLLQVVSKHFSTTLSKQNQPHPLTVHVEFPRRTERGLATCTIKEIKLGRQVSSIHVALHQNNQDVVLAYVTQTNLDNEKGATFPTGWQLDPIPANADFSKFPTNSDPNWLQQTELPYSEFRKASHRVKWFHPRHGQPNRSIIDQWISFEDGSPFTTESLGFVADMFPQIVENFLVKEDPAKKDSTSPSKGAAWYPTVVLNIEVKKAVPKDTKWLFCRTRAKQIKNGRLDIEVVIKDETGDIVALSHHTSLILNASRNLAKRKHTKDDSKM